jgi:serine/threonine protein phosphatase 1
MKRTFVIGDIHGGLKALEQVLMQTDSQYDDRFIFLGDYVDGWSESAQVISFLIDFKSKHDVIFIRGNHDQWCGEWLKTGKFDSTWLAHGGLETIKSYSGFSHKEKQEHFLFFDDLVDFHIDHDNRLFVHAGFTSMHGVHKEVYRSNFSWDRTLWEAALLMKEQTLDESNIYFPKRFRHYKEIYIGHTPTTNYSIDIPIQAGKLWNVDTGAAFTGKVSIMEVESKRYWQSDQVAALYPDEKGRN